MSRIFLHNTLGNKKEEFKPNEPGKVSMYNCGPTVYNFAHIGNLRSYVFADILRRMFEYNNYDVKQVINITDIGHLSSDNDSGEDKMTKALKREGKPLTLEAMRDVANFYFQKFKEDLVALNTLPATEFPFASDHIDDDVALIETLSQKGFTYKTSDGIYFDISKFKDYGKLGNVNLGDNEHSRIETNPEKRNQRDFAVWKFNSELGYEASFGKGFPGWHIECSAMIKKILGETIDIHTGGIDHIPVHHNNEIAQSFCANDKPLANYWMHNAFLTMGTEKMAKSDDNFITLQTLKDRKINPLAYRYLLLTARYSSPLQFSPEALEGADNALRRLKNFMQYPISDDEKVDQKLIEEYRNKFIEYINDDLDTPKALAFIWDITKEQKISMINKQKLFIDFDKVLGLKLDEEETIEIIPENVQNLIKERDLARNDKNFAKSDEIRKQIESLGYAVKDTPLGTVVTPL